MLKPGCLGRGIGKRLYFIDGIMVRRDRPNVHGERAWAGLIAGVVAYDTYAILRSRSTMSTAFYEISRSSRGRLFLVVIWAVLTGHLFRLIPKRFDPMRLWEG